MTRGERRTTWQAFRQWLHLTAQMFCSDYVNRQKFALSADTADNGLTVKERAKTLRSATLLPASHHWKKPVFLSENVNCVLNLLGGHVTPPLHFHSKQTYSHVSWHLLLPAILGILDVYYMISMLGYKYCSSLFGVAYLTHAYWVMLTRKVNWGSFQMKITSTSYTLNFLLPFLRNWVWLFIKGKIT